MQKENVEKREWGCLPLVLTATLFVGGVPLGGVWMSWWVPQAPEFLGGVVGFFMFPLSFMAGMLAWQFGAFVGMIMRSVKTRTLAEGDKTAGAWLVIPASWVTMTLAGAITCYFAPVWWQTLLAFMCAGALYGMLMFIAARMRLLIMLDS